jgi:6-phosphogluconolactonase
MIHIDIVPDADAAAKRGALLLAEQAREAIEERGRFLLAVSGGRSPWIMFKEFSMESVHWDKVHVFQVDERAAPAGDPDRNWTHLRKNFLDLAPIPDANIHPMPVEEKDLRKAALSYSQTVASIAGSPPILDLIHLGLGPDGHTASLVPGDPVLDIRDADIGVTAIYQGRQRLTMTYPILNRARRILWLVAGSDRSAVLSRLRAGDPSIPAGRVNQEWATMIVDRTALGDPNE